MRPFIFVVFMVCFMIMGYWLGSTNMIWYYASNQLGQNVNQNSSIQNMTLSFTSSGNYTSSQFIDPATWQNKHNAIFDSMIFLVLSILLGITVSAFLPGSIQNLSQGLFSALFYVLPMILAYVAFNYLLFPFSFLLDPNMPIILGLPIVLIYNALLTMAIYTAARGTS